MRIAFAVGVLMMNTMGGNPGNGSALHCERAANSEKVFEKERHLIGPVSMQPVIAHADAKPGGYPIQKDGSGKQLPAKNEQCGNCGHMKNAHYDRNGPIYGLPQGDFAVLPGSRLFLD